MTPNQTLGGGAFTPGPWSVADNGFWVVRGMLSDEKLIAKVAFGDVGYARERANARLIAAAPELFEALRNLVDRHFLNGGKLTDPAYIAAKDALAKAREQSQ